MAKGESKREIEVEIEENGRKLEIEIEEDGATAEAEAGRNGTSAEAETRTGRKRSGAGFLPGLIFGAIAGAIAAVLFSPQAEDSGGGAERVAGNSASGPDDDRAQSLLNQLRARIAEAQDEARDAAREAEGRTRARYEQLTRE